MHSTAYVSARCVALVALAWSLGAGASAQPFSPSIAPNANPITIANTPEKLPAARPKVEQQTLINMAFGATAQGGNTRAYGATLGGRLSFIRHFNQLTIEALGTVAAARQQGLTDVDWTARNVVARARYDYFLSTHDALFVALAPRRDTFARMDLRLQSQIGYLRNLFLATEANRLWAELGYDFTYDKVSRREEVITNDVTPEVTAARPDLVDADPNVATTFDRTRKRVLPGDSQLVHSARIFFGYTNRLFTAANLTVGAETLLDFQNKRNVRVNGLAEFTSSITHSFKLGVQGRVLYDNVVETAIEKVDTLVTVQLVYTFDSQAGALNAPCPLCDCTPQVQAARNQCRATEPLQNITR